MKPEFENPIVKREQFAVNLRKKKTQDRVQAKRRKIMQMASKTKLATNDGGQSQPVVLVPQAKYVYNGYHEWL